MKNPRIVISKPSLDPRNPRENLDAEWFGRLVETICELGAPIRLSASDSILCADLDLLRDLETAQRFVWLRRAKREALRQYLDDRVDQIREAAEADDDTSLLLGGFIFEDFDGRNDQVTPIEHATLGRDFYGEPLRASDIRHWTKLARAAARPPTAHERDGACSVVYFISLSDPAIVKIGFSSNFAHRLRSLRTASPVEPHVHLALVGGPRLEAKLHDRFRADHIRREWFNLSPEIKAFIQEHTAASG